jgi:pimeloyl-ACP methyl ester carboxylesterase
MLKQTLFVSLAMTTACATSDRPIAPEGGTMARNAQAETQRNLAFARSKDGTQIAFERTGSGPPLVIVGGALADRNGGKPLAAKLSDRFTVYTYDRRGRGDSGDTKPYAVAREIEDLEAIIEQAGNQANVYGVSSGAALTLQSAAQLGPAKVAKLAVYDTPYGQSPQDFAKQKQGVNQRVRDGQPGDAAEFFFSAIGTPPPALEKMKTSPEWVGMQKIDFTLTYDYEVLGDGQVPDKVKQISVPTLVMTGEKSIPFMQPAADRIAQLIPGAQRKTLPGQAHQAAPEVVVPLLIQFFDASGTASARSEPAARASIDAR